MRDASCKVKPKLGLQAFPSIGTCSNVCVIPGGYHRGRKTGGNVACRKWFMPGGGNIPFFFQNGPQTEVEKEHAALIITL